MIKSKNGRSAFSFCLPHGGLQIIKSTLGKFVLMSKNSLIITPESLKLFEIKFSCNISQAFLSASRKIHFSAPTFSAPIPRIPFPAPKSPIIESEDKSPYETIDEMNLDAILPSVEYCSKSTFSQGCGCNFERDMARWRSLIKLSEKIIHINYVY